MLDLYKLDDNECGIEAFVTKFSAQLLVQKEYVGFLPFKCIDKP